MSVAVFGNDLEFTTRARRILDDKFYPHIFVGGRFVVISNSPGSMYIQRNAHIDLVGTVKSGSVTVEEKIVRWKGRHYTAMTLETHSDLSKSPESELGDGWMRTSEADRLVYALEQPDCASLVVYVYRFPKLKKWFEPRISSYRIADTVNEKGYTTRCRIVPFCDIPKECVSISDRLVK